MPGLLTLLWTLVISMMLNRVNLFWMLVVIDVLSGSWSILLLLVQDITYVVGVVRQYMHAPRPPHFEVVCHILRYLKSTPSRGLLHRPSSSLTVTWFSDYDWAGSCSHWQSTSSYCTFVAGNLVTWRSKKRTAISRSSDEAEYRCTQLLKCCGSVRFFKTWHTYNFSPMPMFCDHQVAIFIASNPVVHERTKHIEVDCHFIRDLMMKKKILLLKFALQISWAIFSTRP